MARRDTHKASHGRDIGLHSHTMAAVAMLHDLIDEPVTPPPVAHVGSLAAPPAPMKRGVPMWDVDRSSADSSAVTPTETVRRKLAF